MDSFKIELLEKNGVEFPFFLHLEDDDDLFNMQQILLENFNHLTIDEFMEKLDMENVVADFNASNESEFNLFELFKFLGIPPVNVFINWGKFDNIDEISFNDLGQYFYDLWFHSADNIDIFDDTYRWIVSIRHDGVISCTVVV